MYERVCVAVAGLLEERSTFVFDFRVRSARFDVQECSSKGKTENATGCPAHMWNICTYVLQNRVSTTMHTTSVK